MAQPAPPPTALQEAPPAVPARGAFTRRELMVIVGPVLALVAFTAVLAVAAWVLGWHPELLAAAAGVAGVAILLAIWLLYRQVARRLAADRALQNARARVSGIVDSAMDAIITIDETQHIVLFNAAAEAMFGYPRAEAIGAPLAELIPDRFRGVHADHVRSFDETGIVSRRMGGLRIVTGLRRDGEEFPIDAAISQLGEHGSKLYTVILRDITERVRAEEALRRSKEELQELASAAHQALEQEKTRIARELHDELAQALTALKMDVSWYREKAPPGDAAMAGRLERMETMLDGAIAATRRIAADLRPLMLDDLGLLPAIEWLAENFTERTGVTCELNVDAQGLDLEGARATAVFRIVQESLANIVKHARASRAEVTIRRNGSNLAIQVRDDGRGFSPQDPRRPDAYGLLGLRERASLLGGTTSITSAPGRGTYVEVHLPLTSVTAQS